MSNKCSKPEFIADGHFMRIPVNDSHNEKLLPHFIQAFQFVGKILQHIIGIILIIDNELYVRIMIVLQIKHGSQMRVYLYTALQGFPDPLP